MKKIGVCYFGSFLPEYSRNRVLIKGLRENHYQVYICNDLGSGLKHYLYLLYCFFKIRNSIKVIIVGAVCQHDMPFAWILSKIFRKKLIFDIFISLYDTYVFDRQSVGSKSLAAKKIFWWDKLSCILADQIILDTREHAKFFVDTFNIPSDKIGIVNVGVDTDVYKPGRRVVQKEFVVHFHGSYQPLQGVELILETANLLKTHKEIVFRLIGDGPLKDRYLKKINKKRLRNIEIIGMVSYESLASFINSSDICLGIFGDTLKSNRVIPNKAVEAIALKKPLITQKTIAILEKFEDQKNVLLVEKRDPKLIMKQILELKRNKKLYSKIANNGYKLFLTSFTHKIVGRQFGSIINELLKV